MRFLSLLIVFFALSALTQSACTYETIPAPEPVALCDTLQASFQLNVKAILNQSCAYSGCHPGYSDFKTLEFDLKNGSFKERVFDLKDNAVLGMPPDNAPAGRPKDLTEEELELLDCWLKKGYPEK
jgi:hypothetical protein